MNTAAGWVERLELRRRPEGVRYRRVLVNRAGALGFGSAGFQTPTARGLNS